jgi:uncharacterized protein with FMN-binding domain
MRRVVLTIISTVTGLVMLLSFKTHAAVTALAVMPPAAVTSSSAAGGSSGTATKGSGSSTTGAAATATASTGTTGSKTVTGDSINTRWGPVQVQITVTNGKITAAQAVQAPQNNPRDQQINSYAIPMLNQEAIKASSATIDMVSGATYTSTGYIASLQSAVNKAGI